MGFTLGRPDVVAALAKLKSYLDYGTFQPIQIASIVALREAADYPPRCARSTAAAATRSAPGSTAPAGTSSRRAGRCSSGRRSRSRSRELGSLEFALKLAREADVAVSPGIGFGPGGDGHVRFALVENEQRIRQATRSIRKLLLPAKRDWRNVARRRGAMLVPRQGRRERS